MAKLATVGGDAGGININPASAAEEIIQNLGMILSVPKHSAPMYRDFGVAREITDKPIEAAKSLLVGEVMDAVERFEPRCAIEGVTFTSDHMTGRLIPKLEVTINDGRSEPDRARPGDD